MANTTTANPVADRLAEQGRFRATGNDGEGDDPSPARQVAFDAGYQAGLNSFIQDDDYASGLSIHPEYLRGMDEGRHDRIRRQTGGARIGQSNIRPSGYSEFTGAVWGAGR